MSSDWEISREAMKELLDTVETLQQPGDELVIKTKTRTLLLVVKEVSKKSGGAGQRRSGPAGA